MNGTFYAIYNKDENKFLSVYEDGEGNEYYSLVEFEYINQGALFETKLKALEVLSDAISIAGFSLRLNRIPNSREFVRDAKIVEIEITFKEEQ